MLFGTGLIVFRETLEAALFIGILAAATRGLKQRSAWLALGVAAGITASLALAAGFSQVSAWADGLGQELVTTVILACALVMLAWHSVWGSVHAREMVQDARRLGSSAADGSGTLWAVALAVAMVVVREGAETVLFVAGMASDNTSLAALAASVGAGVLSGGAVGLVLYLGLGQLRPARLFAVTHGLILLLAGSLASQLARTLSQAGWTPWLSSPAWDISEILPNESSIGLLLRGVIGYDATPSVLQVTFYVLTIALIHAASTPLKKGYPS